MARALNDVELAELRAYIEVEGRDWKNTLQRTSWWRGEPAKDKRGKEYPSLYGLRNTHGYSWLATFKLPPVDSGGFF